MVLDAKYWGRFLDNETLELRVRGGLFGANFSEMPIIFKRRRPEQWYGIFWLWETWACLIFGLGLLWSIWQDHRSLHPKAKAQPVPKESAAT